MKIRKILGLFVRQIVLASLTPFSHQGVFSVTLRGGSSWSGFCGIPFLLLILLLVLRASFAGESQRRFLLLQRGLELLQELQGCELLRTRPAGQNTPIRVPKSVPQTINRHSDNKRLETPKPLQNNCKIKLCNVMIYAFCLAWAPGLLYLI